MGTFIDTSAILALSEPRDALFARARAAWTRLRAEGARLVATSFVLTETASLLQARIGLPAVRDFHYQYLPAIDEIVWITAGVYSRSIDALLAANRRSVSLTDWSSFIVMRDLHIRRAFAFDPHFAEQGFELVA